MNFSKTSLWTLLLASCATPSTLTREFSETRVLERMGNASETPAWSHGAEPLFSEGGNVFFTNTIAMSGDSRPEACTNAAADLARVQILRQIKDNLTSSGQLSEVSASSDPSVESLTAYLAQGHLSGVKVSKRYWERREESDSNGIRILRVHCASQVSIARSILERQLRVAIDGAGHGNPQIRQTLLDAQKQFLDSLSESSGNKAANHQASQSDLQKYPAYEAVSDSSANGASQSVSE